MYEQSKSETVRNALIYKKDMDCKEDSLMVV
jgi:hypothetical protein